jgi:hypothetical protein
VSTVAQSERAAHETIEQIFNVANLRARQEQNQLICVLRSNFEYGPFDLDAHHSQRSIDDVGCFYLADIGKSKNERYRQRPSRRTVQVSVRIEQHERELIRALKHILGPNADLDALDQTLAATSRPQIETEQAEVRQRLIDLNSQRDDALQHGAELQTNLTRQPSRLGSSGRRVLLIPLETHQRLFKPRRAGWCARVPPQCRAGALFDARDVRARDSVGLRSDGRDLPLIGVEFNRSSWHS